MTLIRQWRICDAGEASAIDLHAAYMGLAEVSRLDSEQGLLLLGRSTQPHLVIGASQFAHQEINLAACAREGIPVIQRPLGGGVVWVDQHQLCLFFMLSNRVDRQVAYSWVLDFLCELFQAAGVNAATKAGFDIWCEGRKLAGTGAASIGNTLVIGSSVLEQFDSKDFCRYLRLPNEDFRDWLVTALNNGMTSLEGQGTRQEEFDWSAAIVNLIVERGMHVVNRSIDASETRAIDRARAILKEPLESGERRRVRFGLKINRSTYLFEHPDPPLVRVLCQDQRFVRSTSPDPETADLLRLFQDCDYDGTILVERALQQGWTWERAHDLVQRLDRMLADRDL